MKGSSDSADPASAQQPCLIVAVLPSGEIVRHEGRELSALLQVESRATISWMDYSSADMASELDGVARQLGFNSPVSLFAPAERMSAYEDLGAELRLKLPSVKVMDIGVEVLPLMILVKENALLTVHPVEVSRFSIFSRYAETFMKKLPFEAPAVDKISLMLARLMDENCTVNFEHLRRIEEQGDLLSKELMDTESPPKQLGPKIYKMKHSLIRYLDALWATVDVLNSIRYGDAELISDEPSILQKFSGLVVDLNQQISLTEHLSDVLASGLEVLQSIYNNQLQVLNNRLALVTAYLTILGTAALVPNTIATILGNTAFAMVPSDRLWYIALLVGSTALSTYAAYRWTKKRGLLRGIS